MLSVAASALEQELGGCNRNHTAPERKMFTIWASPEGLPTPVVAHRKGALHPTQDGGTLFYVQLSATWQESQRQLELLRSPDSLDFLVAKRDQAGMPGPRTQICISVVTKANTCTQDPKLVLLLPTPGPWVDGHLLIFINIPSQISLDLGARHQSYV